MSAEPAPPIQSSPPALRPGVPDAPRHLLILFMILVTGVLFIGLVTILYVRWAGAQEPSSALIVAATPAFDGAEIAVEGVALANPYVVTVDLRRGPLIPFYLDRGSYTVRVSFGGKTVYAGDVILNTNEGKRLDLSSIEHLLPPSATTPASSPPLGSNSTYP